MQFGDKIFVKCYSHSYYFQLKKLWFLLFVFFSSLKHYCFLSGFQGTFSTIRRPFWILLFQIAIKGCLGGKHFVTHSNFFYYYSFKGTIKNTLTAKNGDASSSTPWVRTGSLICTRDNEHPRHCHKTLPPGLKHPPSKAVLLSLAACQVSYLRER